MPELATAPERKLIIPAMAEAEEPSNMPKAEVLESWQRNIGKAYKKKDNDPNRGKVVYVVDHLFPEHDVSRNLVNYRYRVVIMSKTSIPGAATSGKAEDRMIGDFLADVVLFLKEFIPAE